jgi:hypothetical protein
VPPVCLQETNKAAREAQKHRVFVMSIQPLMPSCGPRVSLLLLLLLLPLVTGKCANPSGAAALQWLSSINVQRCSLKRGRAPHAVLLLLPLPLHHIQYISIHYITSSVPTWWCCSVVAASDGHCGEHHSRRPARLQRPTHLPAAQQRNITCLYKPCHRACVTQQAHQHH